MTTEAIVENTELRFPFTHDALFDPLIEFATPRQAMFYAVRPGRVAAPVHTTK